ncbi:MAG: hypothetical protein RKP20_14180 [Candidatus Competibacter sp.]|nr:hypothetical protein [Candidatus Competibacter sp.]
MRNCLIGLLLFGLLAPGVRAEPGTVDNVPAATLLLPYFEVDLGNPNGVTTLFAITNIGQGTAFATAILAHVTLWTDLGVPTLGFDIYLTGFDVQTINARDIFNGVLPSTASDGQDPTDTISPQGPISQDINFASCTKNIDPPNGPPLPPDDPGKRFGLPYANPLLTAQEIAALRSAHTGQASGLLGGNCGGANLGDNVARGYITVDTVNACNRSISVFPGSPGYFGPGGTGTNQNYLAGDFFLVDPSQNFAQGDTLVHVEADPNALTSGYTFYGRLVNGAATDSREPLATQWIAPYQQGGSSATTTDLLVWRDPTVPPPSGGFACGGLPAPFPLGQTAIVVYDSEGNATPLNPANPPFPYATQRVRVGGGALPVAPRAGWLRLDLNTAVSGGLFNGRSQSHVTVLQSSQGRFSGGHAAIQLDNAR